jgi:multidrug efflux pump subunit AcrA (membrane-fusion protein)
MIRWIVGIICTVVALAVLGLVFFGVKTEREEQTYVVKRREMGRSVRGLGKVESRIPEQPLGFVIGGRLKCVLVIEGQAVKAGEKLAELETPDFDARIAAAQAALSEALAREKQVALGPRPEEYKPLEVSVLQAAKEIEAAMLRLKQLETPIARPVSESELELARLDVKRLLHQANEAVFSQQRLLAGPTEDELAVSETKWQVAKLDARDAQEQYDASVQDGWKASYGVRRPNDQVASKNQIDRAKYRERLAQAEYDFLKKGATEIERKAAVERAEAAKQSYEIAAAKLRYLETPVPLKNTEYDLQLARLAIEQTQIAKLEADAALARAKLGPRPEELEVAHSAVIRAQKALDEIQALGDQGKLIAPTDGIILERYREPGSALLPGTPVVRIGDTKDLRVRTEVSADSSAQLRPGQVVALLGNFLSGGPLSGKINRIIPTAGPKKLFSDDPREIKGGQVVEFLVDLDTPQTEAAHASFSALRPGIRVDVRVDFDARGKVLGVPRSFVRFRDGKYLVLRAVTETDGKVGKTEEVEIEIGWRDEMDYEVISGLREDDKLVKPVRAP